MRCNFLTKTPDVVNLGAPGDHDLLIHELLDFNLTHHELFHCLFIVLYRAELLLEGRFL